MSMKIGVGHSTHRNPNEAGKQAAEGAMKHAGIDACDFVLMFATFGYDQQTILNAVRKVTKEAPLSGGTGGGVIAQGVADESNHACSVMVFKGDAFKFKNVKAVGGDGGPQRAGDLIAEALGSIPDNVMGLFVFADAATFQF